MQNMRSVNEVSKLSGVIRRTLQYYDEIGLLPPSSVKESGYRQYDDDSLCRLWNILFYKNLGMSLDDIRLLLENPKERKMELLRQHKQALVEKQTQLQRMMLSVDCILNDDFDVSMLRDFDENRIEAVKKTYAKEIKAVIEADFFFPVVKSGILPKNMSLIENASKIINMDLEKIIASGAKVAQKFQEAMKDSPESLSAKEAVADFKVFVNMVIPCDDATFRKIGHAYLEHKSELDKKVPGLAEFVSMAILHVYP